MNIKQAPFWLAVTAFIVTMIVLVLLDQMLVMIWFVPLAPFMGLAAALVTFSVASICLHSIEKNPSISLSRAAWSGALWGFTALLILALLISIFTGDGLKEFFGWLLVMFIFGGFLAPVLGSIIAYKAVKQRQE